MRTCATVRSALRDLAAEADRLKDSVHRDEVARAEQRLRIEQLQDKALEDFGIEPDMLVAGVRPRPAGPAVPAVPGDEVAGRGARSRTPSSGASRRAGSRPPSAAWPCSVG